MVACPRVCQPTTYLARGHLGCGMAGTGIWEAVCSSQPGCGLGLGALAEGT